MNEKVLKTLEYNKILNQLSEYACSPEAKKRCLALRPITDKAQIEQLQLQTKDALSRLFRCGNLSFSGVHSVNDSLKRLEIGASLSAAELLSICSLLEAAKRVKAFSRSEKEEVPDDSLTGFFTEIEPLTPLYDEIKRCILAEDEIADDASSTLRSIRRSMRGMNDRIRAQMNNMINNSTTRSYLQDAVITMRGGRYCLPVKAEAKSQIPGMVHDQSSSGSTLFIEPMAVVNLNNEYKELLLKEKDEIEKILENLSNLTANFSEQIAADYTILAELDFIFAKAAYAQTYNNMQAMFYSLAGGVLSLLAMIALSRIKGVSVIGVSALGAVGFNIGQILMAVAMLHTPQLIVTYLPVLMVSGVATGVLTGVVAQMVMKHLKVIEKKA